MPNLSFRIEGAEVVPYAAVPLIALKLHIANLPADQSIHSLSLRCQIQIEPARRSYVAAEQQRLTDLFGEPARWGQTVRSLLWMNTTVSVPSFAGTTIVDLLLPCSFDFNVATTKYFDGLDAGDLPLCVMFSGTVFYSDAYEQLQMEQIPWDREASYRLPVQVWKQMMDEHYPNTAWLCLPRDAFRLLYQYKVRHGIPTWEQVIEKVVPEEGPRASSAAEDEDEVKT